MLSVRDPLELPSVWRVRGLRQYYRSWMTALFSPQCRKDVIQQIRRRVGMVGNLISSCRCGALQLVSEDAPRQVAVCHCSVCRYDEAKSLQQQDAPGPSFATVRRDKSRLIVNSDMIDTGERPEDLLIFRESSEMARRGRCRLCGTFLVLDYEWFEPNTLCLVRPVWREGGKEDIDVEFLFNDGMADFDVCWDSRFDLCKDQAKLDYLGGDEATKDDVPDLKRRTEVAARGKDKWSESNWSTLYYIDSGTIK